MSTTETLAPISISTGSVKILPYLAGNRKNMGLEKYNMVVFDGIVHSEQLACIELNGITRFITGLDEFAPEVKGIPDEAVRNAKIKEIRKTVAKLEQDLVGNILDIEDKEFWNKVEMLKPTNATFWNTVGIACSNDPITLEPEKDPMDLIKVFCIEAGGFSMVAKNFDEARSCSVPPKFYLDRFQAAESSKLEGKKTKNMALAELQKIYDSKSEKLFFLIKCLDANSIQYKTSTPKDTLYDQCDKFINGQGLEKSISKAAQMFLDTAKLTMTQLKIKSIVRDAMYFKFINHQNGAFYHVESNTLLGDSMVQCIEALMNPMNDKILDSVQKSVEAYWVK